MAYKDLSFPTRDWIWALSNKSTRVLTTGSQRNSPQNVNCVQFIYFNFVALLGFCHCARVFSSYGKQGLLSSSVAQAAYCSGFSCDRTQTGGLRSCGTQAQFTAACGILLDQGPNPCPLRWQADCSPLGHQGGPYISISLGSVFFWDFLYSFAWTTFSCFFTFLDTLCGCSWVWG